MGALLDSLGLNLTTFLSQLVNFAILYFLLKKFALDKLIKAINKRQEMIAKGVRNAQDAQLALTQAQTQQDEIISDARAKARGVVTEARQIGKEQAEKIVTEAKSHAEQLVTDAHEQIKTEKQKMLLEVQGELADIIAIGVEKVATKKVGASEIGREYLQVGLRA